MATGRNGQRNKRSIPAGLSVVCLLLLADGILVLLGCLFYPGQDVTRPYYALGSFIIIATSILIWIDHKWALPFSFVSAVLVTADLVVVHISLHTPLMSANSLWETAGPILNIALYWVGFLWYKKWRAQAAD